MRTLITVSSLLLVGVIPIWAQEPVESSFVIEVQGSGPPMILVPGLTSPGQVWARTVEHYKDRYTLHVVTLAGFAGIPPIPEPSTTRVRDDLIRYIDSHKLERVIVVGHSLGGFIAYRVAAAAPDRVAAVVSVEGATYLPALFDPGATPDVWTPRAEAMRRSISAATPESFRQQSDAQLRVQVSDSSALAWLAPVAAQSDPQTTAQFMYELYTTDIRQEVQKITAPVLLVVGTAAVPPVWREAYLAAARKQVETIPKVEVQEVPGARHFVQLDDPATLHKIMDDFLARAITERNR
ncbi:MAG: alpha/beta hydrolase [candidate division KSB1 bacterium]|nr:alpha/beta hydrolase [candidate division KSB1 bacterium]